MVTHSITDTNIPSTADKILAQEKLILLPAAYIPMAAEIFLKAMAACLKEVKSKKRPAAFCVDDLNGNMIFAGVVSYEPGEGGDEDAGNWTYVYTFNKSDIPEGSHIVKLNDTLVFPFINNTAYADYKCNFDTESLAVNSITTVLETIYHWLGDNAIADDEVAIDILGNLFKVSIINGEIVRSAEPSDELRTAIKSDSSIEV